MLLPVPVPARATDVVDVGAPLGVVVGGATVLEQGVDLIRQEGEDAAKQQLGHALGVGFCIGDGEVEPQLPPRISCHLSSASASRSASMSSTRWGVVLSLSAAS